jgi:uncharacterized protein YgiM (DUF1202 family)
VKGDYVNVRAGTALYANREPSAVLTTLRKGAKLTILGSTEKYYQIAPPENARVYVSPQFVQRAPAETTYKVPDLKLPAGMSGPSKNTVSAPTALPPTAVEAAPTGSTGGGAGGSTGGGAAAGGQTGGTAGTTTQPAGTGGTQTAAGGTGGPDDTLVIRPPAGGQGTTGTGTGASAGTQPAAQTSDTPAPAVTFSTEARTKYDELNKQYQAELQKPPMERNLDPLISGFRALLGEKDLAPSVKMGSESRVAALEKLAAIQRLAKENASSQDQLAQQRQALQQEYAAAAKAIEDYEKTGPYLAEGLLQTSAAVEGKYALVNPKTGRVVAYVDPAADVDIGSLMGKYIGVRGTTDLAPGTQVSVIHVRNATLLPAPEVPSSPPVPPGR